MKVTCSACGNEVELKEGYLREHRKKKGKSSSKWCDGGGRHESFNRSLAPNLIADHTYDAGWPRDDSQGCIAEDAKGKRCRAKEGRHERTEYLAPGDMHEPKPYTGELDWPPTDAIPFT